MGSAETSCSSLEAARCSCSLPLLPAARAPLLRSLSVAPPPTRRLTHVSASPQQLQESLLRSPLLIAN